MKQNKGLTMKIKIKQHLPGILECSVDDKVLCYSIYDINDLDKTKLLEDLQTCYEINEPQYCGSSKCLENYKLIETILKNPENVTLEVS